MSLATVIALGVMLWCVVAIVVALVVGRVIRFGSQDPVPPSGREPTVTDREVY